MSYRIIKISQKKYTPLYKGGRGDEEMKVIVGIICLD